jgi:hypothetical protein
MVPLNTFYRDYNLYSPQTAEGLADWWAQTPFATPYRHCLIAVGAAGNLVAGLALVEACRLMTLDMQRMPAFMRLLNAFDRFVPSDGVMRQLTTERLWHMPGYLRAARSLFEAGSLGTAR